MLYLTAPHNRKAASPSLPVVRGSERGFAASLREGPEDKYFRLCGPHIILRVFCLFYKLLKTHEKCSELADHTKAAAAGFPMVPRGRPAASRPGADAPPVPLCLGMMGRHHGPPLPRRGEDSAMQRTHSTREGSDGTGRCGPEPLGTGVGSGSEPGWVLPARFAAEGGHADRRPTSCASPVAGCARGRINPGCVKH